MANTLILLDDNHISVFQLQMAEDRILETYIYNLFLRPLPMIEPYLMDVRFLHVSHILKGMNWTPQLSASWSKDGSLRQHTFHTANCYEISGHWRLNQRFRATIRQSVRQVFGSLIKMKRLQENFDSLHESSSPLEREQHTQTYI
ncbi:hypothetical protein PVK06_034484 [Gossypium arboreum]|uniref:Uncharacterized protein n=1 Tax=Gossypium arboreum TaxID=29729 RepID=A0ABR0NFA6_GOSAR|nr:hypothetical protein PVK06_034484 [Gossypium arboreum]